MSPLVVALLLFMGFHHPEHAPARYIHRAESAAVVIEEAAEIEGVDKFLLGAIGFRESGLDSRARGRHHEKGRFQINPKGMGKILCRDLNVNKDLDNAICGARILKFAQSRCGTTPQTKHPRFWLGTYNGKKKCGPGHYSKRVLGTLARARSVIDQEKAKLPWTP